MKYGSVEDLHFLLGIYFAVINI